MPQQFVIVGVNHRTAAVKIRERLAFPDDDLVNALSRLRRHAPSVSEAALVSTCNRVELIGVTSRADQAAAELAQFVASDRGLSPESLSGNFYRLQGRDALRHLFRVGASLDSMVVGEPQILGQLKTAYLLAAEAGTVGLILHRAFHRAFSVAKKVREQTLIGYGAVSAATAAVGLARQIFDSFEQKTVLLLGAGEMAETTARHLMRQGVEALIITNRTFERAVALARALNGTAVPFDNFKPYLKMADVVIGSLATLNPVLAPEDLQNALYERKYRPIFLIDLGVPRNFHEALNGLDNVYLYDIDALADVVAESQGERVREARKAEQIVELELDAFWQWFCGLEMVPAIKRIRANIENIREAELAHHQAWLASLPPEQRRHVEGLTKRLINKILHQILAEMRRTGDGADSAYVAEVAQRLLGGELALLGAEPGLGAAKSSSGSGGQ